MPDKSAGQLELVAVADGSTDVLVMVAMVATILPGAEGGESAGADWEDAGGELIAATVDVSRVVGAGPGAGA